MSPIKKILLQRIALVYIVIFGIAIIISVRLVNLKVFEKKEWAEKANVIKEKDILSKRGSIYSTNHKLLASSIPYYDIRIDLSKHVISKSTFKNGIDSLCIGLSKLFQDIDKYEYKKIITKQRKKGNRYFLLKKNITYSKMKALKKLPIFRLGQFKGGIIVEKHERRVQPHGRLAHRTIGYKNESGIAVGIEGAFDAVLSGYKGKRLMQKVSGSKWIPLNETNILDPIPGLDVITTIDVRFQDIADEALEEQLIKNDARHGSVIVMEIKTGEIKAIVNLKKVGEGRYYESHNSAIGELSEPGSTFKLASLLAAMEDGYIELNDTIDTKKGSYKFYDRTVRDTKIGGHGRISVKDIFAYSSNIGVARIIFENYKGKEDQFISRLHTFGLDEKTDIIIKGEEEPEIKSPEAKSWSGTTLPWMAHGYELKLSPLQILNFYNTIANDGIMLEPMIVKALQFENKIVKTFKPKIKRTGICSEKSILNAKKMLEAVVEYGTGRSLQNKYFKVAGKTGTAQLANTKYGYKSKTYKVSYQASFAGYFPADNPKYSCIVVVNSPKKDGYYATKIAIPIFKKIMLRIYALEFKKHIEFDLKEVTNIKLENGFNNDNNKICNALNINIRNRTNTNNKWGKPTITKGTLVIQNIKISKKVVPNVVGMGLRDALNILEKHGLKIRITGSGKVVKQSIKPGAPVNYKQIIYLNLNV